MTIALAIILLALLMLYAGIKGRSLRHLIVGQAVSGGSGKITQ